ncbi:MAG: MBL fold metallo-hydrolase, partial [Caldilineaceae bacterium]|nr:MBL fold metallo-hydrolase [Caldilineaceae bacterium]
MKELLPGLWHFESPAPRVNAYLWSGRRDLTLVDCGYPGHGKAMLEEIQDCGFRLTDIGRIVLTHADLDHAGGLYELSHALRVPVLCHRLEAPVLQHPGLREFRTA